MSNRRDHDPKETQDWIESLEAVIEREGPERASFLIDQLVKAAGERRRPADPLILSTPYFNTIPAQQDREYPGDLELEERIANMVRWNAMAMVVRANRQISARLGGHVSTFSSAATLYEVGFHHFFRGPEDQCGGDLVFFQGHCAPGIYSRAFLEGRLSEKQLANFRREAETDGLSAYPHPFLMPGFWQFSTVSLGLAPLMAIYQARFLKYLHNRGVLDTEGRKVWAFLGDGEMDEPEALGGISAASREGLDNLIFVVNCNLQRLDGPVRGNGKIIQELESIFRGAGWNVIKVIWGSSWDRLLHQDRTGLLCKRMEEAVDGEYQRYRLRGGAYLRRHFFGKHPELLELVSEMSDEELGKLNLGGHDPVKVCTAYHAALRHSGGPSVILAKSVKGYGLGVAGEALNVAHQVKSLGPQTLIELRDRFEMPLKDHEIADASFYQPPQGSPEIRYLLQRRKALGGFLPAGRRRAASLPIPALPEFDVLLQGSGQREISTTMVMVRLLAMLLRNPDLKERLVPIVADEARTFGMEGLFRQIGIYSPVGQLYEPVDSDQLMSYKEAKDGQMLQEGVSEAAAICSWIAAATSGSNHGLHMIPFYVSYSMFGFQRVGDLIWAAADMQARGFLVGATAGRTTLNGEGLQHQDGHSHLPASAIPSCLSYDPAYSYEVAVIVQDGLQRMYGNDESIFFYLTLTNENYLHPPMPPGAEEGIRKGMYLLRESSREPGDGLHSASVQLIGSGAILREVEAAANLLEEDFGICADVWSVTSFTELRRQGLRAERWNRLHPEREKRCPYVTSLLKGRPGPVVAATDYMKAYADQIRAFVPARYTVLGTDGFGRSDTRSRLRSFFEVDRYHIAFAAVASLAEDGVVDTSDVVQARERYRIDPEKQPPESL